MIKRMTFAIWLAVSLISKAQDKPFVIGKFDSKTRISSNPIIHNDNIYFGNDGHIFFALDAATLNKKWSFKTASTIRSKPVLKDHIIYFKSGYEVYAMNCETGEQIWSYSKQPNKVVKQQDYWDYHAGVPAIHQDNIYFGFEDGSICGFDLSTGGVKVKLNSDDSASIKSGLIVRKDILYFGDWNGKLYAYDLTTNKRLWKYDTYEKQSYPTFGQINTELTIYQNLLFFGARNPEFQVIEIESAQKKWSYTEQDGGWISGDPLIYNDTLFVAGSDNHKLIAFDPATGEKYWEYEFLFNNFSKPVIYKNHIFFTTGDAYSVYGNSAGFGYLYALNRKTGSVENFSLIGGNLNSTPVIKDEHLFLCSEDGFVYKIDVDAFLNESEKLSANGYRAFEQVTVDTKLDSNTVRIDYKVNYESAIKIRITDLSDYEVKELVNDQMNTGNHNLIWDKLDNDNTRVKPGYYILEIKSGDSVVRNIFNIE